MSAGEIEAIDTCQIERVRHREVRFTATSPTSDLLALRTIDDLFAVAVVVDGVGRTKDNLDRLNRAVKRADLQGLTDVARTITGTTPSRQIDVSASFVGRRNYNRFEIEDVVGNAVAERFGATYYSRSRGDRPPHGTTSWRVTIEEQTAVVGLRLASRPLHRRIWKQRSVPGTLHPPLAAAMAYLAHLRPGDRVLDPCCGAGTLLIEASHLVQGLALIGSDTSRPSLQAATANARGQARIRWALADAGSMPLADNSVDRILINPPWQRQVDAQAALTAGMQSLWWEARRVLRRDGLLVALIQDTDNLGHDMRASGGWAVTERRKISLFGAHPEIVVAKPCPPGDDG